MMELLSTIKRGEEKTMDKITTIGLDLGKNVFHAIGCDAHGKVIKRKMLRRSGLLAWFANLPPSLVGMEA